MTHCPPRRRVFLDMVENVMAAKERAKRDRQREQQLVP